VIAPSILALAQARLPLGGSGQVSAPLTLDVRAGMLVVIDPQGTPNATALADACVGLSAPLGGRVLFQGRDWQAMGGAEADAARGQIGHCFSGGAWIAHLPVLDNLTLAQRHHGLLPEPVLALRATALARQFGLPGVPTGLPGSLDRRDLARANLVRAFLGRPALVILEEPRRDLPADITAPLVQAIRRVRDRGGAVLWLTAGRALAEPAIPADARYRLAGGRLIPLRAETAA
jgi:phospholipid/cholesterol/gamma-HCH transport system ATP-binding protein